MAIATDYLKLRRLAAVATSSAVFTEIAWDTEDSDASGYWASGAATKVVVPTGKAGIHLFTGTFVYASGVGTRGMMDATIYNSSDVSQRTIRMAIGVGEDNAHVTGLTKLAAGDYIIFAGWQSTGSFNMTSATLELVRIA